MKITQEDMDAIHKAIVGLGQGHLRDSRRISDLEKQVTVLRREMAETIGVVTELMRRSGIR